MSLSALHHRKDVTLAHLHLDHNTPSVAEILDGIAKHIDIIVDDQEARK